MLKSFSSQNPKNSSKNKILKEDNKRIVDEKDTIQAKVVSAIKQQKPIEDIEKLLQPHLPKDTLVLLAIKNIIYYNRLIKEVKKLLELSVSLNNLVINEAITDLVKHNRTNKDIEALESYKPKLNDSCYAVKVERCVKLL